MCFFAAACSEPSVRVRVLAPPNPSFAGLTLRVLNRLLSIKLKPAYVAGFNLAEREGYRAAYGCTPSCGTRSKHARIFSGSVPRLPNPGVPMHPPYRQIQNPPYGGLCIWRRERDSNPRGDSRPPNDLANRPLQPLGYLSSSQCDAGFCSPKQAFCFFW